VAAASRPASAASSLPIARVAIDSPLPHLDRPFDYLVPEDLSDHIVAGSRVRVRFAGRLIDGWVLERVQASDHDGRLAFLQRGIGSEPVLTPDTAVLFRAVADRWAGTFADVVRLAVPPRHARAETAVALADPGSDRTDPATGGTGPDLAGWQRYRAGSAFVGQLERGGTARAIWNAMPSEDWPLRLAELAAVAQRAGRGPANTTGATCARPATGRRRSGHAAGAAASGASAGRAERPGYCASTWTSYCALPPVVSVTVTVTP